MNMIRHFFIFSGLIFLSFMAAAQQPNVSINEVRALEDEQVQNYIQAAKDKGYTLPQLETLARVQGATQEDILRLREAWTADPKEKPTIIKTGADLDAEQSFFGQETFINVDSLEEEATEPELTVFGMQFFNNPNISESPQLFVATPASYRLGPGDEITIDVWGASEQRYEGKLSREGVLKIDRLPPLYLSGQTLESAQKRVVNAFSSIYTGLQQGSDSSGKVYLDVNLKKARTVVVNISGQVKAPGTYTLSGFSSVLNALYAAGGPNENGSFRNIQVLRAGRKVATVDLYDYFVNGVYPALYLNDQDIVMVPPFENRIYVEGAFKTLGEFEILQGETIQDALDYAGGFGSSAYKKAIFLDRVVDIQREIQKVDKENFQQMLLQDGDKLKANEVSDKYTNKVTVEGAVFLPGDYPLEEVVTLSQLLQTVNGPTPEAYLESALLYRTFQGVEDKLISVDLKAVLAGTQDFDLQPDDRLMVVQAKLMQTNYEVKIEGAVNSPDVYPFYEGMTAQDLLLFAQGYTDHANTDMAVVYRNQSALRAEVVIEEFFLNRATLKTFVLAPSDIVVVRTKAGFQSTSYVTLKGMAQNPGIYPLLNNDYKLYDLLKDANGALEDAALEGVSVQRRRFNKDIKDKIEKGGLLNDSLQKTLVEDVSEFLTIGVDASAVMASLGNHPDNISLKADDVINIPRKDKTITVVGAVNLETAIPYIKGMSISTALNQAGGVTELAKRKNIYVIYQNGAIKSRKRLFFVNINPKLKPGAIVVVPEKQEKDPFSIQDGVNLTTSLATLTVLIRTLTTQ